MEKYEIKVSFETIPISTISLLQLFQYSSLRLLTVREINMIAKITAAYIRHYHDNGQTTAYVEWIDGRGKLGRTEGRICSRTGDKSNQPAGPHLQALFARAEREGVTIELQTW